MSTASWRAQTLAERLLALTQLLSTCSAERGQTVHVTDREKINDEALTRAIERALVAAYEDDLDLAGRCLFGGKVAAIRALLELPKNIRGYGPVRGAAYHAAMTRRATLRSEIGREPAVAMATE